MGGNPYFKHFLIRHLRTHATGWRNASNAYFSEFLNVSTRYSQSRGAVGSHQLLKSQTSRKDNKIVIMSSDRTKRSNQNFVNRLQLGGRWHRRGVEVAFGRCMGARSGSRMLVAWMKNLRSAEEGSIVKEYADRDERTFVSAGPICLSPSFPPFKCAV
jgi:hypothetical protein